MKNRTSDASFVTKSDSVASASTKRISDIESRSWCLQIFKHYSVSFIIISFRIQFSFDVRVCVLFA